MRREHRFVYPTDWPHLSAVIRFERAKRRCEVCARPHGRRVFHLTDGRWWDGGEGSWRDGAERFVCPASGADDALGTVRTTCVILTTGDRDTTNNATRDRSAFGQRSLMNSDRPEHQRRRWYTLFRRRALGDLFRARTRIASTQCLTGSSAETQNSFPG
nr:hypothetical protein [Methylobacterium sp. Leaf465]